MELKPEQFKKVEEIFHQARVIQPEDRAAFLDEACREDLDLRAEVESLLAHARGESASREGFGNGTNDSTLIERGPVAEGPGAKIGPYKILQKIGEGGFGVVYMAEQTEPVNRKVALKIIKLGMDTKQVIARFEAERQALALMDHPNIAKVLDAGATETGRPYFVMELVKGISLSDYCDRNKLDTKERLELFIRICRAIQHAHQKGIIHRDLKPSNVLVTIHDTKAIPMVIDFGIAKATSRQLTEKTLFTEFRNFIGTPEYMSPDQAEISGLDVDTRTDIFSLGVILYELLTGTTPFDAETLRKAAYGEIQRIIRDEEPPKPSTRIHTLMSSDSGSEIAHTRQAEPGTLSRQLKGDLDWIVMKAMEKDRTRRYQTASELAADLERFLKREPVLAGPPSIVYKTRKFVLRHRLGVTAGCLIAIALITGLSVATVGLVQAQREANRSQQIAEFLESLFISTNPDEALVSDVNVNEVLDTARDVFGNDHATVAAVLTSRALQLQSSGDLASAEAMYRRSLDIWREQFGEDNIQVGTTLGRLGIMLHTKGDEAAAEEALRESLRILGMQANGDSLASCEPLAVLASIVMNRGEYDEGEALFREAIRIRKEKAPQQHLQTAMLYLGLGNSLGIAGRIEDAAELAEETIEAWRHAVPSDSLLLGRIMMEYSALYAQIDRLDEAEPMLLECLDILELNGSSLPQYQILATRLLYRIYEDREDFVSAIAVAMKRLDHLKEIEDAETYRNAVRGVANLGWRIAADPEREDEDYRLAHQAVIRALSESPDNPAYLNTRAVLEYRFGQYEKCLATCEVTSAHYTQEYPDDVPADLAFIAMAHFKLGHIEEAKTAFLMLRKVMEQTNFSLDKDNQVHLAEAEALLGHLEPKDGESP